MNNIIKTTIIFLGNAIFGAPEKQLSTKPKKVIKLNEQSLQLVYDNGEEFIVSIKQTKFLREVAGIKMYVNEQGDVIEVF